MKKHYFVVDLAHSFHGRLRRLHVSHRALYIALGLGGLVVMSLIGVVSSYANMAWKVAKYDELAEEVDTLRGQYQALLKDNNRKDAQLASLQMMASEVSAALGLSGEAGAPLDIETELIPSYTESMEEYNFLKSATFSRYQRNYPRSWQQNIVPNLWPVNGRVTSRFGDRQDPFSGEGGGFHAGVDITAESGTPVHAAADGIVFRAEFSGKYGRLVVIEHGNGMTTRYAHLSKFEVIPGEEIRRGQVIGLSGASGHVTAPHLHFEVRQGGSPVNPSRYLSQSVMLPTAKKDLPF